MENVIVKVKEQKFICSEIVTATDSISFSFKKEEEDLLNLKEFFADVKSLEVTNDTDTYGKYEGLEFVSAKISSDNVVTIKMHIMNDVERRLAQLEQTQTEQDGALAEILYGGVL